MGFLEQFAQRTFALETRQITHGAVDWQDVPEIRLEKVTADGYLVIREPRSLASLPEPWPQARAIGEVMLELKMAGNHLDPLAVSRSLLRRRARHVQRLENTPTWSGEEPLWLVASIMPDWLRATRNPERFAPGCYRIGPPWYSFLWIASNELPLEEELIPFLLTRTGQALDELAR